MTRKPPQAPAGGDVKRPSRKRSQRLLGPSSLDGGPVLAPAAEPHPACTSIPCADVVKVTVHGLRLHNPLNQRQGWRSVWRRGKAEKDRTRWAFMSSARPRGTPTAEHPWTVTVTRCGPGMLDHHDALPASAKHVVDAVAEWIGVDDKRHDLVRYVYDQRRAKEWSVEIVVEVRRG